MEPRARTSLPDEAVPAGAARHRPGARRIGWLSRLEPLGGTAGNEILTSATAALLLVLLAAEGVTVVHMSGLVTAHMFIGMVLIPPVALKLASTGYRFVRYYAGARAYREKGPPLLALRLLAPLLVLTTLCVLATGVWLLALGHKSDWVLEAHKVSFIVWGVLFAAHVLAYLPRVVRSLIADWGAARRASVPGAGPRALLVAAALGGGVALAVALLADMTSWHAGGPHHLG